MRPVVKLNPGSYIDSDNNTIEILSEYNNYRYAKPALVFNLGSFCSYCEDSYHQQRDMDVEHVQPKNFKLGGKKIYAHLEKKWSNFLLSCKTCNGADNKDTKNVVIGSCHLPHLNNTFKSLVYKAGGVVEVNPILTGNALLNATNLLSLIRLDKTPKTSRPGDTRWKKRGKDWDLADKYHVKYIDKKTDVETIIDLVKERGGWSIWFTVFKGCDDVRKALIEEFPGTESNCFDPLNHYEPIDRHPGDINDPT